MASLMRCPPAILAFIVLAAALAPLARAADSTESTLRAALSRLRPVDQEFIIKAPFAGTWPLSRLVTFTNSEGRFLAQFHLPDDLARQFQDPAPLLLALEGSPHPWSLHRRKSGTLDPGLSLVTLTCYEAQETWPFNRFTVASDGSNVIVTGSQLYGQTNFQPYLSFTQAPNSLRLAWRIEADKFVPKKLDLNDASQLATRAPELDKRYLMPILRRLGPARPPSDTYRVFNQIPADPAVTRHVAAIVAELEAPGARQREAAFKKLQALGRPAILATLRIDRALLSAEQVSRLQSLYAADGWVHHPDLDTAKDDEAFLNACLEDEDPQVRSAAANTLAAIQTLRQLKR